MKVTIVKYLNPKGKVVEMRKDNFKGGLPENIIEEYEVEIKGEDSVETGWLEELKRKYSSGNYILIFNIEDTEYPDINSDWRISTGNCGFMWESNKYKLIHNNHKDILEAYLKNPSVQIETGVFVSINEDEPSKWVDLEKDFIEDYKEEFQYRLKVKDLAWYEDKNIIGKVIYDGLNKEFGRVLNIRYSVIETTLGRNYFFSEIDSYKLRPATEAEVLSLVYKPQQKVSKENPSTESNILRDLFLDNKVECLIENEQEFRLVYDFLDKTCDKSLNRRLVDGQFDFSIYKEEFPIILSTPIFAENLFGWDNLEKRNFGKPLIKFDGEIFWKVSECKH